MSSAMALAERIGIEAGEWLGVPIKHMVSSDYFGSLARLAEFLLAHPDIDADTEEFTSALDAAFNRAAQPWSECSQRQQCWRMRVVDLARRTA